jgi:hypothetical protein
MSLPKIIYGSTPTTLQCQKGPAGFICYDRPVTHDNVATSGLAERVIERVDTFIAFRMPALKVNGGAQEDDLEAWGTFARWAMAGGEFEFYPQGNQATYYHCKYEGEEFRLERQGPAVYSADFVFRIVPDGQAPAGIGTVYELFYGIGA